MRNLGCLVVLWLSLVVGVAHVMASTQTTDDGAAVRGQAVFQGAGCLNCHTLNGEGRGTAVELSSSGFRVAFLAAQNKQSPSEAMEEIFVAGSPAMRNVRLRLSDEEARDVAAYVATLREPLVWEEFTPLEAVQGMAAFVNAGCSECHTVAGVGGTAREDPIPLLGVRQKSSQQVVLQKLAFTNGGPVDPERGMRNLWAATSEEDRRLILAFVHELD